MSKPTPPEDDYPNFQEIFLLLGRLRASTEDEEIRALCHLVSGLAHWILNLEGEIETLQMAVDTHSGDTETGRSGG